MLVDGSTRRTAQPSLRMDLPSVIEMLEATDAIVGEGAAAAGFVGDAAHDIRIAAHEAVINAIVHGNRKDEARRVRLEFVVHPGGFEVRVQDEGRGFDAGAIPDPLAPENVWKPSGRGILLMRALMDEVLFRRLAGGGMEVTMRKRSRTALPLPRAVRHHEGGNPPPARTSP